ncbi:MAG: hypothetical protein HQM16_09610 [Deltaproteobacteria bacterium]|nr:hypothetical protein [Deltaproteobacteria bacterium]
MKKTIFYFLLALVFTSATAHALVGAHSYKNDTTGDVFLGGDYIEVGISKYGSFGTTTGQAKPAGFYGTATYNYIGMSTNAAGFGVAPDYRIDYFIPGSPEERWVVGYKISGTPTTASNAFLMNTTGITDNTVTNDSTGTTLKATSIGTLNSKLKITQVIQFEASYKFFYVTVTLQNIGTTDSLDNVRYMRSFDPDNTVLQSGSYTTHNEILYTHAAGDGKAVVSANTANNASDPIYLATASRSPIVFYSSDTRAKVSTFGFANTDPYTTLAYDTAKAKGTVEDGDQAITLTVDVGTLAPGESDSFVYFSSLDNRDFNDILAEIQAAEEEAEEEAEEDTDDGDNITIAIEDAAPNSGDANGDGTIDSLQSNVTSFPNEVVGNGAYTTLATTGCESITAVAQNAVSTYGTDTDYEYPVGLTAFTIDCANAGDTATIVLYYHVSSDDYDSTDWEARKYIDSVFEEIPNATFSTTTVGAETIATLTYQVTDGGDLDSDGTADGVIIDPAGPAIATATTTAAAPAAPYTGPLTTGSLAHPGCALNIPKSPQTGRCHVLLWGLGILILGLTRVHEKSTQ